MIEYAPLNILRLLAITEHRRTLLEEVLSYCTMHAGLLFPTAIDVCSFGRSVTEIILCIAQALLLWSW